MKLPFLKGKKSLAPLDPDEILADSISALAKTSGHESKMERPLERVYLLILFLLIAGGIFYLGYRSYSLALSSGDEFFKKSQENRFLVRPIYAPRGVIADHKGKTLVENIPSFGLVFEKKEFLERNGNLKNIIKELSLFLKKSPEFFYELGFPEDYDISGAPSQVFITRDIPREKILEAVSLLESLPGVEIFESYSRKYQDPYAFSHVLGFVGKISQEELALRPEIAGEETVGKSGLESFYDKIIRGRGGKKIIEVDSRGRETRFKLTRESETGSKIALTLDGDLEKQAYHALENYTGGRKGASVVIVDPRSGAVRALVSYPGFDANSFGYTLSHKDFAAVLQNPLHPLFNRAISGEFPSGSVIKPLIAAAALEEKIIDPNKKIYDEGFIEIPNPYKPGEKSVFVDWRKHGWIDFYDAIAWSANVYFYMIGGGYKDQKGLGIERIKKYAEEFGLGSRLGIDLPGEKEGFIPDPETKKISEPENPVWRIGDTYNVSIGQGGVKITPLQMDMLTAAIANGGKLYKPYLLETVFDKDGKENFKAAPQIIRENMVSKESLEEVKKGMRKTVTVGTARLLAGVPVSVAAKTGTAQAGSGLPHAWVTAFAPVENPEIAITVMVEHAGEGATVAVPITHEILQWYFSQPR